MGFATMAFSGKRRMPSSCFASRSRFARSRSVLPKPLVATTDSIGRTLYEPGSTERASDPRRISESVIERVAGNGNCCDATWTAPATAVAIDNPTSVAPAPDGSFYFAASSAIYRVDPLGALTIVAGSTANNFRSGFTPDGAVAAGSLVEPFAVAVAPDGTVYFTEKGFQNFRVRRIVNGRLDTVAGGSQPGTLGADNGDGGAATAARLIDPIGLVFASDGTLYIDDNNALIRRVTPDGTITTIAGGGSSLANETPAIQSAIDARSIAVGSDGSVFLLETLMLRKITPDGVIHLVAGSRTLLNPLADGSSLTSGSLSDPFGLAVAADGTILFYERNFSQNARVRAISGNTITTFAGAPTGGDPFTAPASGLFARAATLGNSFDIKVGPDGAIYLAQHDTNTIYRTQPLFPTLKPSGETVIPDESGVLAYVFGNGRHTRTVNTLTGNARETFTYDATGHVISVTDSDNQTTTVERDSLGLPTAIVAPGGQRTTLAVGSQGLANITNPAGETYEFSYNAIGLLSQLKDPRSGLHKFTYDDAGRLIKDEDPVGGFLSFARSGDGGNVTVTRTTTEGRTTTYASSTAPSLEVARPITGPDGLTTTVVDHVDGSTSATSPDGMTSAISTAPDPRFGMSSSFVSASQLRSPSGLTLSVVGTRQVSLANPNDPLSLTALTDTTNVNGRTFTSTFARSNRTLLFTSPKNRTATVTFDAHDHTASFSVPNIAPISFGRDTRGLLTSINQSGRISNITYDDHQRVLSVTDALHRTTSFEYDDADRVTKQTLPDGRNVAFTYDAAGNLTSVTPPARPAHGSPSRRSTSRAVTRRRHCNTALAVFRMNTTATGN
jgi:YD repeat-containing protein